MSRIYYMKNKLKSAMVRTKMREKQWNMWFWSIQKYKMELYEQKIYLKKMELQS
jgi:hypothetical protein